MIALIKAFHIAALALWCAGLLALPIMLHLHGRGPQVRRQAGYAAFRLLTHRAYTRVVTPAAVVAIAAGSTLIVLLRVIDPWMLAKLAVVSCMVLLHVWLGHLVDRSGAGRAHLRMLPPLVGLVTALPLIGTVLWLVLAKPDLSGLITLLPEALRAPQGRLLPEAVVPI